MDINWLLQKSYGLIFNCYIIIFDVLNYYIC